MPKGTRSRELSAAITRYYRQAAEKSTDHLYATITRQRHELLSADSNRDLLVQYVANLMEIIRRRGYKVAADHALAAFDLLDGSFVGVSAPSDVKPVVALWVSLAPFRAHLAYVITTSEDVAVEYKTFLTEILQNIDVETNVSQVGPASGSTSTNADLHVLDYRKFIHDYQMDGIQQNQSGISDDHINASKLIIDDAGILVTEYLTWTTLTTSLDEREREGWLRIVSQLAGSMVRDSDYIAQTSNQYLHLTEKGRRKAAQLARSADEYIFYCFDDTISWQFENALIAAEFYEKGQHYVVKENQIHLLSSNLSGSMMEEFRYPRGIQQALEIREGLPVTATVGDLAYVALGPFFDSLEGVVAIIPRRYISMYEWLYAKDVRIMSTNAWLIRSAAIRIRSWYAAWRLIRRKLYSNHIIQFERLVNMNSMKIRELRRSVAAKLGSKGEALRAIDRSWCGYLELVTAVRDHYLERELTNQGERRRILQLLEEVYSDIRMTANLSLTQESDFSKCRVCGLAHANAPWGTDGETPTHSICDCCGVEFGNGDATLRSVILHRRRWLREGGEWFNPGARPSDWDRNEQLSKIPQRWYYPTS